MSDENICDKNICDKIILENNEYYNDLLHYRKYPYVNFKDFNNDGFSILLNNKCFYI